MTKEHGAPLGSLEEADVVIQSRIEAKHRYQQFRKLSMFQQAPPGKIIVWTAENKI